MSRHQAIGTGFGTAREIPGNLAQGPAGKVVAGQISVCCRETTFRRSVDLFAAVANRSASVLLCVMER